LHLFKNDAAVYTALEMQFKNTEKITTTDHADNVSFVKSDARNNRHSHRNASPKKLFCLPCSRIKYY